MRWFGFAGNDVQDRRRRVALWLGIVAALCVVLVLDATTPTRFQPDDLYLPIILAVGVFERPRYVLVVAAAASVFDVAGFFPNVGSGATGWAVGDRALGVLTIWLTASLVLVARNLWAANTTLQAEIAQRERAERDLKKALAVKDDFLGMVSHEMRTPLTAIIGASSLLADPDAGLTDEERTEFIAEVRTSTQRLAATIENMLTLARVEAGQKAESGAFSLRALIDDQVAEHLKRHGKRKIRTRQDGHVPDAIGCPDFVRHTLANLIENAEKYSPPQEPIEIDLRRERGEVTVRVLDRGAGLTEEEAEHVFEAFYRSSRLARGSSGMGIGLSVCKRLVEEQGGRIWALPRQEGGSEFGFTLPVAPT
jgi:signal transduction histidine kinase